MAVYISRNLELRLCLQLLRGERWGGADFQQSIHDRELHVLRELHGAGRRRESGVGDGKHHELHPVGQHRVSLGPRESSSRGRPPTLIFVTAPAPAQKSEVVVQLHLVRMRPLVHLPLLAALARHPALDQVAAEHPALKQELRV